MEYSVVVIICMLILSAFFSGMEIAYVSSNKVHLAIEKKQKGFISLILQKITKRPSKFIGCLLEIILLLLFMDFLWEIY